MDWVNLFITCLAIETLNTDSTFSLMFLGGYLGRCNFEFNLCSWKQDRDDEFDWSLRAGSTPTLGTGPVTDHSLQNPSGSYIFIESSFPQLPGQVAKLSGPLVSKWSRNCKVCFIAHAETTCGLFLITSDERTQLGPVWGCFGEQE